LKFGTLEHWNTGTLEHWNTGTLEHWNFGTISRTTELSLLICRHEMELVPVFNIQED
jgi:hypothetical protein